MRPCTASGGSPNPVDQFIVNVQGILFGPNIRDPAIDIQPLGIRGNIGFGNMGGDGQIDETFFLLLWSGKPLFSLTASARSFRYISYPTASMCPCCWAPRRLPAPRISMSRMAILNPAPNSVNSRDGLQPFGGHVGQDFPPYKGQKGKGATRRTSHPPP